MPEPVDRATQSDDESFTRWLFARRRQPNVMIDCEVLQLEEVAMALLHWCRPPMWYFRLPGRLDLPDAAVGTLLLADAGSMTGEQARALDEWLDRQADGLTVVSVTSVSSEQLLEDQEWPQRLLYRLNVIRLPAAAILAMPIEDGDGAAT